MNRVHQEQPNLRAKIALFQFNISAYASLNLQNMVAPVLNSTKMQNSVMFFIRLTIEGQFYNFQGQATSESDTAYSENPLNSTECDATQ